MLPTWSVLLFILVVVGVILWGRYRTRQRRPAVARFASQHGMSYCADGSIDTPGYDFPLLRKGDRRGYHNVLAGR